MQDRSIGVDIKGRVESVSLFSLPDASEQMAEHISQALGCDWSKDSWFKFFWRSSSFSELMVVRASPHIPENIPEKGVSEYFEFNPKYKVEVSWSVRKPGLRDDSYALLERLNRLNNDLFWAGLGKRSVVQGGVTHFGPILGGSFFALQDLIEQNVSAFRPGVNPNLPRALFAVGKVN